MSNPAINGISDPKCEPGDSYATISWVETPLYKCDVLKPRKFSVQVPIEVFTLAGRRVTISKDHQKHTTCIEWDRTSVYVPTKVWEELERQRA